MKISILVMCLTVEIKLNENLSMMKYMKLLMKPCSSSDSRYTLPVVFVKQKDWSIRLWLTTGKQISINKTTICLPTHRGFI